MKKISVNKNDEVAAIVDKILHEPDPEIALVIPKFSKLKELPRNFNLLKREAESAGKRVSVESVDEEVLTLAEASGLFNEHPFFSGPPRSISDIVPSRTGGGEDVSKHIRSGHRVTLNVRRDADEEERVKEAGERFFKKKVKEETDEDTEETPENKKFPAEDEWEREEKRERSRKSRKKLLLAFAVLILIAAGGIWLTSVYFASAEVVISFSRFDWQYADTITAGKNITQTNAFAKSIPAEVFHDRRNLTQLFPATGKSKVSQKASGKIRIVNAYSSEKQTLVATTRFAAPDGKIFRLDNQILVPGAQIKDGKIIPSSVESSITADQPGAGYNIGPIDKMTIPGFKGTPKYEGFYGKLEKPLEGGFEGEKAVPTENDIQTAQDRTSEILRNSLESNILTDQLKEYKILEGASGVSINKITVKKETNPNGQFSVFGEAELQAIGFKEEALLDLLNKAASSDLAAAGTTIETSFRSLERNYSEVKPDYGRGELRFNLSAQGTRTAMFDPAAFAANLAGKSIADAKSTINSLPGLASGRVLVWPIWLKNLPQNTARIKIVYD